MSMDLKTLLKTTHHMLEAAGIDHALIGGLALGALGVQRFTNDIDFLVRGEDKLAVKRLFLEHGYSIYYESPEVLQIDGPGQVDFLFANRQLSAEMLLRAERLPEIDVKCLGVEDIIGLKIQAYCNAPKREFKDKADIQALVELYADRLDWEKVQTYAELFGQWEQIQAIGELTGHGEKIQ